MQGTRELNERDVARRRAGCRGIEARICRSDVRQWTIRAVSRCKLLCSLSGSAREPRPDLAGRRGLSRVLGGTPTPLHCTLLPFSYLFAPWFPVLWPLCARQSPSNSSLCHDASLPRPAFFFCARVSAESMSWLCTPGVRLFFWESRMVKKNGKFLGLRASKIPKRHRSL